VRGKKLMFLGLVMVLALVCVSAVACGEKGEDGTATMQAALDVVEEDIRSLTTMMMAGGTTADVKDAKEVIDPHWQAVIDACAGVKDADAVKAQQLWDDVAAAIDGVAADANLVTLAGAVMGPVSALQAYEQELRNLVGATPAN
jgi:hypothetical protein